MALKELERYYYRIDKDKSYVDNGTLKIAFIVYPTAEDREREKAMLPILEIVINSMKKILEDNIDNTEQSDYLQAIYDLYDILPHAVYNKHNEAYKTFVTENLTKYNIYSSILPYVENPINRVHEASIYVQDYTNTSPTLEEMYNILKKRIGNNVDC